MSAILDDTRTYRYRLDRPPAPFTKDPAGIGGWAMTHLITWDHTDCEHDDSYCTPTGFVTCQDPACRHRLAPDVPAGDTQCLDAEVWFICTGGPTCADGNGEPSLAHVDPGVPHSDHGHPLVDQGECMATTWLNNDEGLDWDLAGEDDYRDGPIAVEFDCGSYQWHYLDTVPRDAVG